MAVEGSGKGNLGGDDGPTEQTPSMSKAVFPSSLGLSFCVPLDVTALKVTPRWGRYDKAPSAFLTNPKTGTPKRVWKRQPCGTSHEIPLKAGPVGPIIADEAFPDAKVKGLIRRRTDHWSVTLFLVNEGVEPPPPNRERTWMFQCELAVEAPDGSPIFHWPDLRRRARRERRVLVFEDESGFYLLPGVVRTYAPEGRTPVIREKQTRDHLSVMGGMTPEGKVYTLARQESLNGLHSIEFLVHLGRVAGSGCW